jgi:hypothetical protein
LTDIVTSAAPTEKQDIDSTGVALGPIKHPSPTQQTLFTGFMTACSWCWASRAAHPDFGPVPGLCTINAVITQQSTKLAS